MPTLENTEIVEERTYPAGRSTRGFCKGERVREIADVSAGDILIGVSHRFPSQNLYVVRDFEELQKTLGFVDCGDLHKKFYLSYVSPSGTCLGGLQCVWDFEVHSDYQEYYLALPAS